MSSSTTTKRITVPEFLKTRPSEQPLQIYDQNSKAEVLFSPISLPATKAKEILSSNGKCFGFSVFFGTHAGAFPKTEKDWDSILNDHKQGQKFDVITHEGFRVFAFPGLPTWLTPATMAALILSHVNEILGFLIIGGGKDFKDPSNKISYGIGHAIGCFIKQGIVRCGNLLRIDNLPNSVAVQLWEAKIGTEPSAVQKLTDFLSLATHSIYHYPMEPDRFALLFHNETDLSHAMTLAQLFEELPPLGFHVVRHSGGKRPTGTMGREDTLSQALMPWLTPDIPPAGCNVLSTPAVLEHAKKLGHCCSAPSKTSCNPLAQETLTWIKALRILGRSSPPEKMCSSHLLALYASTFTDFMPCSLPKNFTPLSLVELTISKLPLTLAIDARHKLHLLLPSNTTLPTVSTDEYFGLIPGVAATSLSKLAKENQTQRANALTNATTNSAIHTFILKLAVDLLSPMVSKEKLGITIELTNLTLLFFTKSWLMIFLTYLIKPYFLSNQNSTNPQKALFNQIVTNTLILPILQYGFSSHALQAGSSFLAAMTTSVTYDAAKEFLSNTVSAARRTTSSCLASCYGLVGLSTTPKVEETIKPATSRVIHI